MVQPSGAPETFSAALVSLRPAKELPVVLSIGETEVMIVAGDRPLDRGPVARSSIRRAGSREFLLLIEGRGWQIRVDDEATFMRQVMPRFGQGRFIRLRMWWASWSRIRDPLDGTIPIKPWAMVTGLAWVLVLVVGFVLGRLETRVAGVLFVLAVVGAALLGPRWARLAPRATREVRPPARTLRPVAPEPVPHSSVTVGMAGDVDLVREILGDRLSGRTKVAPVAPPPTARRVPSTSIPAPPIGGVGSDARQRTSAATPAASDTEHVEDHPAPALVGSGAIEGEPITVDADGEESPPSVGAAESPEQAIVGDGGEANLPMPEPDDLTAIRGIGPRLAARLAGVGVVTFRQLAELGEDEIARLQAELGTFVHRMNKDRWQDQAREAHARKYGG